MARPGLTQHRKFLRLSRLLGNAPLALGCLEFLWEKCYQNGEPYLGDVIDVEAAAMWPGEPGALCRALLDAGGGDGAAGFIEEVPGRPERYQCHDLFDHAPRYVGKRLERELARIETGQSISQMRSEVGRKGAMSSKRAANGQQTGSKTDENEANDRQHAASPAPAPAPAPLLTCAEPAEADATPAVLTFPCKGLGATPWPVTQGLLRTWAEAYPGVDVLSEARKMLIWLKANPRRGKTARGMPTFAMWWLERAQNTSRGSPTRAQPYPPPGDSPGSSFPKLRPAGDP